MASNALEISNYYKTSLCHPDIKKSQTRTKIHPLPHSPKQTKTTATEASDCIQCSLPYTTITTSMNSSSFYQINPKLHQFGEHHSTSIDWMLSCKGTWFDPDFASSSGSYLWVQIHRNIAVDAEFNVDFDFANCSTVSLLLWFEVRPSQGAFYTSQ